MTLDQFKQAIADSPNKDWYQNYTLEINYPHVKYKMTLMGIVNVYQFVVDQSDGYSKITKLPEEFDKIKKRFIAARANMLQLLSQKNIQKNIWDDNLRDISGYDKNRPIFLYESVETEFLLKVNQERPESFAGAFDYLRGDTSKPGNKQYLQGYILAYEFTSKDFSLIAERKEAEKKSILKTASDFSEKLGLAQKETTEVIAKTNQKFEEYAKAIDLLKEEKNKIFTDWFGPTSSVFSKFNEDSNKKIKDLENLYIEKLKLEAPAQYWNKRAAKLRNEGRNWLIGMIACLVVASGILIWLLNMVANGTLQKIFSETSAAIKWSVTFITLISFLAYGIRTFAKLTFSSFHLVRDAEEREQLTYVYLALKNEQSIDATERHLIMQSLFSRADSGLLKDDSGPTMPGQIIDQVSKK